MSLLIPPIGKPPLPRRDMAKLLRKLKKDNGIKMKNIRIYKRDFEVPGTVKVTVETVTSEDADFLKWLIWGHYTKVL
jgi:hypothetical protein